MIDFIEAENVLAQPAPAVTEPEMVILPEVDTPSFNPTEEPPEEEPEGFDIPLDPEETAEAFIDIFDLGQSIIFPKLYERALFSPADKLLLSAVNEKVLNKQVATNADEDQEPEKIQFTAAELKQLRKAKELEDYTTEIVPLTEKEKDSLKKPLVKLLNVSNVNLSPGIALVISVVIISITRMAPILGAKKQRG
jgi:hypothetical protein